MDHGKATPDTCTNLHVVADDNKNSNNDRQGSPSKVVVLRYVAHCDFGGWIRNPEDPSIYPLLPGRRGQDLTCKLKTNQTFSPRTKEKSKDLKPLSNQMGC
jgi:hypothetical protein